MVGIVGMGGGELADALAGGGNALLVVEGATETACAATTTVVEPGEALLLGVCVEGDAETLMSAWARAVGTGPKRAACILLGDERRGGAADCIVPRHPGTPVVVDAVADPGDLSTLGQRITRRLADWEHVDGELVVCFDSLSALLDHVDVEAAFAFLTLLTRQVEHAGGAAHYHLDPTAVDAETVATLRPLFDVEVTVDSAGEWAVRETG